MNDKVVTYLWIFWIPFDCFSILLYRISIHLLLKELITCIYKALFISFCGSLTHNTRLLVHLSHALHH